MITLKNVTKEYRLDEATTITPIRDVSLEVDKGDFLMIVGRSGSGKTTLLNLCSGLIRPTSGQVLIDGQDIQTMSDEAVSALRGQRIGFIFQFQSLLPNLSVLENVAMPATVAAGQKEDPFKRATELLRTVGLGERVNVLPKQLSAGELRRVAIARALMNRPRVILADEPTADLDEQTEQSIMALLREIHRSGVSIMMITHNLSLVPYADRAYKVENGGLTAVDPKSYETLRKAPDTAHRPVAAADGDDQPGSGKSPRLSSETAEESAARRVQSRPGHGKYRTHPAIATLAITGVLLSTVSLGLVLPTAFPSDPEQTTPDPSQSAGAGLGNRMTLVNGIYVVDPPAGEPFVDPPVLANKSNIPDTVEVDLTAKQASVKIAGQTVSMLTYNGSFPGPTIKVKKGDILKIKFTNSLPRTTEVNILGVSKNYTNLHTHGLDVSPQAPADDMSIILAPGQSYDYVFDLSKQDPGTLNFIHGHIPGLTAEQLWSGMIMTVLVEDDVPALANYERHVMVLKDITASNGELQPYLSMSEYVFGKYGDTLTVNGQVNPVLSIKPGQVQRWTLLNASTARYYKLQLDQQLFYVVGTDGGLLDKPYPVGTLLVAPGERVDILVKGAAAAGNYKLYSLPYPSSSGMTGSTTGANASAKYTLLTLRVQGAAVQAELPAQVDPKAAKLTEIPITKPGEGFVIWLNLDTLIQRQLTLSMAGNKAYINGQAYDAMMPYPLFISQADTIEVWTIDNTSGMDQAFYLHSTRFQVLSITGGDLDYARLYTESPALKDVVVVPAGGAVKILVPVGAFAGMSAFHSQTLERDDIGMLAQWEITGGKLPPGAVLPPPPPPMQMG